MSAGLGFTVKPEMPLGDFLKFFDLSLSEAQPEKPLDAQHVAYAEFVRTDYKEARVRISIRYDLHLDIEIEAV